MILAARHAVERLQRVGAAIVEFLPGSTASKLRSVAPARWATCELGWRNSAPLFIDLPTRPAPLESR